jgi:GTPase SAR1 family protein
MDEKMPEIVPKDDQKVKICILSHPKELGNQFIRKMLKAHKEESIYRNFAALGISISTINLSIEYNRIKLILLQATGDEFQDKLRLYYQGASGAIILLEKENSDSFIAAKKHFQYFKKVTLNPNVPIIFMDVLEKSKEILIEEPEKLEEEPNILYYEINEGNFQVFDNIVELIIKHQIMIQKLL